LKLFKLLQGVFHLTGDMKKQDFLLALPEVVFVELEHPVSLGIDHLGPMNQTPLDK
jgi:hypothetical protein